MYDELIKNLRYLAKVYSICENESMQECKLAVEAAAAIEKLTKADPPHGKLKKRVVYRGDVFNAIEAARINALDGILTDRYKDGFHDGLKRALEILANEVQDVPTVIPASEEGET